jgi:hypothetical protein
MISLCDDTKCDDTKHRGYGRLAPCANGKQADDAVFIWEDGSPALDFRSAWKKMCESVKVHINLHDFRRTAARNLVRFGVSEKTAMKISRRVTREIFDLYDNSSEGHVVYAVRILEDSQIGRRLVTEEQQKEK